MHVTVVHGGNSTERISSSTNAKYVAQALHELEYKVFLEEYTHDLASKLLERKPDLVFQCVQGKGHGDGTAQGILEHLGLPYTGSRRESATVINNKILCQKLFSLENIPVAPHFTWSLKEHDSQLAKGLFLAKMDDNGLHFPVMSKAPSQGSGYGIEKISSIDDFEHIQNSLQYDETVLIEQFITGPCFTVAILQTQDDLFVSDPYCFEVQNNGSLIADTSECVISRPSFSDDMRADIKEHAKKAFLCLGGRGYGRIDFMYDEEKNAPFVLEMNAVPGLKPYSLFPQICALHGISYNEIIQNIVESV